EVQGAVAEPLGQESPQDIDIVRDGDGGEPALGGQVPCVLALQLAEWRVVNYRSGWRQCAAGSGVSEKLTKCLGIAAVHASAARASLEKGGHQLSVQLVNGTSTTNQPLIELPKQPPL